MTWVIGIGSLLALLGLCLVGKWIGDAGARVIENFWEFTIRHRKMKMELQEYRKIYGRIWPKSLSDDWLL